MKKISVLILSLLACVVTASAQIDGGDSDGFGQRPNKSQQGFHPNHTSDSFRCQADSESIHSLHCQP